MSKIDINYWMKDVEFGQRRGRLIREFLDLMDPEYQKRNWIKKGDKPSFRNGICCAIEMIFDELDFRDFLEKEEMPNECIGWYLKSVKEAEALYEVAKYLRPLGDNCYTNQEFLESPYLPKVHKASRGAFEIFMENEKDNVEFCKFIEDLKKQEGRM
ncbi:conserved hypothetical protein [Alphaproteobacteria bacterium]